MCPRCQGLMVSETVYSGEDGGKITSSHCLCCGYYTDAVMQANRNSMPLVHRSVLKQHGNSVYPQMVQVMGIGEAAEPAIE